VAREAIASVPSPEAGGDPTRLARIARSALVLSLALAPALARDEPPRTTRDGVYTAEQGERGRQTYQQACAACHALDWYKGDAMRSWEGGTLQGLYESIATTMPQSNPGSLKRSEYVALLAYALALNEMPAGAEELPESPEALSRIVITWRSKQ
jgi:mono/diheme cytochrome c family protein